MCVSSAKYFRGLLQGGLCRHRCYGHWRHWCRTFVVNCEWECHKFEVQVEDVRNIWIILEWLNFASQQIKKLGISSPQIEPTQSYKCSIFSKRCTSISCNIAWNARTQLFYHRNFLPLNRTRAQCLLIIIWADALICENQQMSWPPIDSSFFGLNMHESLFVQTLTAFIFALGTNVILMAHHLKGKSAHPPHRTPFTREKWQKNLLSPHWIVERERIDKTETMQIQISLYTLCYGLTTHTHTLRHTPADKPPSRCPNTDSCKVLLVL